MASANRPNLPPLPPCWWTFSFAIIARPELFRGIALAHRTAPPVAVTARNSKAASSAIEVGKLRFQLGQVVRKPCRWRFRRQHDSLVMSLVGRFDHGMIAVSTLLCQSPR